MKGRKEDEQNKPEQKTKEIMYSRWIVGINWLNIKYK